MRNIKGKKQQSLSKTKKDQEDPRSLFLQKVCNDVRAEDEGYATVVLCPARNVLSNNDWL
jgi:hypothetical protein